MRSTERPKRSNPGGDLRFHATDPTGTVTAAARETDPWPSPSFHRWAVDPLLLRVRRADEAFVRLLSSPAVTATPATRTKEALQTMYVRKIRRMPVVGEMGNLLGIVTQRDLYEKGKADTPVGAIMTRSPYTIAPDASIVRAATLMRNLGVGGLPVLDHGQLVGIITESDIFDAFLELLGARRAGTRIIVPLSNLAEGVARVLQSLAPTGAHVTGLTTVTEGGRPTVIVTADERDPRDLVRGLASAGLEPTLISVQDAAA